MKSFRKHAAFACVLLSLSVGLSVTKAHADESAQIVHDAQIHLTTLGYYSGSLDGIMGPVTKNALRAFQRDDGLAMTGQLTPETFSRLAQYEYRGVHPVRYTAYDYNNRLYAFGDSLIPTNVSFDAGRVFGYTRTQTLPSRFARLDIHEDAHDAKRDYVVTINDHPVLYMNNQSYVLRVSQTFPINNDEDAVIITARQGDGSCTYRNFLLTVRRDGSLLAPREVGNCASAYEAHMENNSLMVSFPVTSLANGWNTWDVWRYENGGLAHI